jgi:hypothetical protein
MLAAMGGIGYLNWSSIPPFALSDTRTYRGKKREGFTVRYYVPFGLPIFHSVSGLGTELKAFSPSAKQKGIREEGDNK